MKYIDGFRDPAAAGALRSRMDELAGILRAGGRSAVIMEICGTHTMAIARHGIRDLLAQNVDLISGPGCPVCVTDAGYLDAAVELARRGIIVATFGDLIAVPGSATTLARCRAEGCAVEVCYSAVDAIAIAERNPDKEIVFLAVGFETTTAPVVSLVDIAMRNRIPNISMLTAFKLVPPALTALLTDPGMRIDAFLCPAHVSAIIGANAYEPFVRQYHVPCVVTGFEPLDIMMGLVQILEQLVKKEARIENEYSRVVRPEGNQKAQQVIARFLQPVDAAWRGIGMIPQSGLALRPEFSGYDAEKRHGISIKHGRDNAVCKCGDVIKGKLKPTSCPLFGKACTPDSAIGPCMVSSEGSCAAYFKYLLGRDS